MGKICLECNFSNKNESIYCSKCGNDLVQIYICEKCNAAYDDKVSYCSNDGGAVIQKKINESINCNLDKYKDNTILLNFLKVFLILNIFSYPLPMALFFDINFVRPDIFLYLFFIASPLISLVLFLIWLFRCSKNLISLGVTGGSFSPISTVLWYFVPIANFVMIHRSMKEIWIYSKNPINANFKDAEYKLVLDWSTLILLNAFLIPFVSWFLIFITWKLTTKINDFQNTNYEIIKNIVSTK